MENSNLQRWIFKYCSKISGKRYDEHSQAIQQYN